MRQRLRDEFDIHVRLASNTELRVGLVGPNAQLPSAMRLLTALRHVLANAS